MSDVADGEPGLGAEAGAIFAHHGTTQEVPAEISAVAVEPANLRRYIAYQFVSGVRLSSAVWVIYLADRGLSLGEIGIAEACFHLAPLVLELPTGSFADILGRKWSLAAGSLLSAVSSLLMLTVDSLWLAAPAMFLAGASMTFESGAQQAFLYDSLDASGGADRFQRVFSRLLSISFVIFGLTAWLGSWLAEIDFSVMYVLSATVSLVAVWLAASLREPNREMPPHRSIRRTIGESLTIVRGKPRLAALLIFTAIFWTSVTLLELYAQAVFDGMGISRSTIGLLLGGSFVIVGAGAWIAHHVSGWFRFRVWTIGLTVLTALAALALGSEVLALAIAVFIIFEFGTGIFEPLLAERVNRDVAATRRATILSLQGFLFSLTMIWAFPLTGLVADRAGWLIAFGGVGAVVLVAVVAWLVVDLRTEPEPAAS